MKIAESKGISLIELLVLVVVISVIISVAMQSMTANIDDLRESATITEMDDIKHAITGDPKIMSNGKRSDFGYVADIGAFPLSLDNLLNNPGYGTWDGPYIKTNLVQDSTSYKYDAWGKAYTLTGGVVITSSGGSGTITKKVVSNSDDYLFNQFTGLIRDIENHAPGTLYVDSVEITVDNPNGSGGISIKSYQPNEVGQFDLDSLTVGLHNLNIIYVPNVDTLRRFITILPNHQIDPKPTYYFTSDYFTDSTATPTSGILTLRPVGVGNQTYLTAENCSNNWSCVDDVTSDDDGSYVRGNGSVWRYDTYETEDPGSVSGTIDSVVIYILASGSSDQKVTTRVRVSGIDYDGFQNNLTSTYALFSSTYTQNPATSSSWTWAELDNIEIGVGIRKGGFVTQVYTEIYYKE